MNSKKKKIQSYFDSDNRDLYSDIAYEGSTFNNSYIIPSTDKLGQKLNTIQQWTVIHQNLGKHRFNARREDPMSSTKIKSKNYLDFFGGEKGT